MSRQLTARETAVLTVLTVIGAHTVYVLLTCPPCTSAEWDYYFALVMPGKPLARRQASRRRVPPWRRQAIVRYADMQPERARRYHLA